MVEGMKCFGDKRTAEIKHDIEAENVLPMPACKM
jgi:hypothetical protein